MTDPGAIAAAVFVTFVVTGSIGACCTQISLTESAREGYQQGCTERCVPNTGLIEAAGFDRSKWRCRCVVDAPQLPLPAEVPHE